MWSAHRITEKQKAGKARNIKEKQLKNSRILDLGYAAYSTDSNVPLSLGILANTVGTVLGGLAHTREEWVWLDSLPKGLGIALSLMLLYVDHLD